MDSTIIAALITSASALIVGALAYFTQKNSLFLKKVSPIDIKGE